MRRRSRYGFTPFSPYTRPSVVEVAQAIPFAALTCYDVPILYALKGEIVRRGVAALTGIEMPVFPKGRFQHGAIPAATLGTRLAVPGGACRRAFHAMSRPTSSRGRRFA